MVLIATTSAAAPTCPADTNPCRCKSGTNGLLLDCSRKNMDDTAMSRMLTNFKPGKDSPLIAISASYNKLTKVPAEMSTFPSLSLIELVGNNIKSLPFNAFNLPTTKNIDIFIGNNRIDSVATGAFNIPSAKNVLVALNANKLKSFSASALKGESITAVMNTAPFNLL